MLSSIRLAGLQLLGGTQFAIHDPLEGLEAPSYRITEYDKPGEDGGVVSASYYGLRPITLNGTVQGGSAALHEANRQALEAVCGVSRDSTGFPVLKLLEITTLAGAQYFAYVQVKSLKNVIGRGTYSNFMLSLTAPDSRLYLAGSNSSGLISRPTGGGFILPIILPVIFAPSSGGSGSATNAGNVSTYPTLTLRGQLTNPYILNSATGESFQLNRTIAVGETVVVDMAEKTVTLNGTSSLLSLKASDSTWWALQPGINPISFSTGSSGDTGTLEVTWSNAVLGI